MIRPIQRNIVVILALILFTGCASQHTPAVTLKDIPLSKLDVVLALSSNPNNGSTDIHVGFFTSQKKPMDTPVFFSGNQTMTCNGRKLTRSTSEEGSMGESPAFLGEVQLNDKGDKLSCIFSSSGVQIPIIYQYQYSGNNDIVTPRNGDIVKRTKDFTIVYKPIPIQTPDTTISVVAVIINLDDNHIPFLSRTGSRVYSTLQDQTGTCHIDISQAKTGNSDVEVFNEITTRLPAGQFHSLTVTNIGITGYDFGGPTDPSIHIT